MASRLFGRLVATLGSKSSLKKISRKAILDVDVQKACRTIEHPQAPLALRLQSNLLYGVARVYSQQCAYVLADVEAAKNSMRTMSKLLKKDQSVMPEGSCKSRAANLVLPDDPNFIAGFDLNGVSLGLDDGGHTMMWDTSQRSTLSPRHSSRRSAAGDSSSGGGLQIDVPTSMSPFDGHPFIRRGGFDGITGPNVGGDSDIGGRREPAAFLDNLFEVGLDGEIYEVQDRQPSPPRERREGTDAESGISSVVRKDHEQLPRQSDFFHLPAEGGYIPPPIDDEEEDQPMANVEAGMGAGERHSSIPVTAESRVRRVRTAKTTVVDTECEVHNSDLREWADNYKENMLDLLGKAHTREVATLAKKNAAHWVMGMATDLGAFGFSDQGPLHIFSREKIFEVFGSYQDAKRTREETDEHGSPSSGRSKRIRTAGSPGENEQARGLGRGGEFGRVEQDDDDDDFPTNIEHGRDAPTPLEDRHHSMLLPWNRSSSQRHVDLLSAGPRASYSAGGGPQLPPGHNRRGSRLVSASPLQGRGGGVLHSPWQMSDDRDNYLPEPDSFDTNLALGSEADGIERDGPPTTGEVANTTHPQWLRSALEGESMNFMDFLQIGIEGADAERDQAPPGDEEDEMLKGSVELGALLPPASNSRMVAAQAFMHVLSLATKNLLTVKQQEAFAPIELRVIS